MTIDASAPIADIGKQTVVELINRSLSAVDKATAFASEQIPDVIQQLLLWKAVQSGLLFILCSVAFVTILKLSIKFHKESDGAVWIFFVLFSGLLCIPLFSKGIDWLYILIAPKVYLLEYAADLVK